MVLHYDETMDKIREFSGLSEKEHVNQYQYFDPKVSINNIRPWEKTGQHLDEIEVIVKELPEYLYELNISEIKNEN